MSSAFIASSLLGNALDEARSDRQLCSAETQRLARHIDGNAVDLKHDPARLDATDPKLRRALALAHAYLGRLLRDRYVGEDADPDAAGTLHVPGDGAACRLNLPR